MSDGKEIGLLFELIQTFKIKCFVEIIILCTSYGLIQFSKYNQCGPFFSLFYLYICVIIEFFMNYVVFLNYFIGV